MEQVETFQHLDDLDAESKYVVHKAKEAASHAYAPYSRILIGAAILLENGTLITGTNIENAAHPSGMCAERVALYAATVLHAKSDIQRIAVVGKKKSGKELIPTVICGSCRQALLEYEALQKKSIPLVMFYEENKWIVSPSVKSLLPFSHSQVNLGHGF